MGFNSGFKGLKGLRTVAGAEGPFVCNLTISYVTYELNSK